MVYGHSWTVDRVFEVLAQVDSMVIRADPGGGIEVEKGPVDGPRLLRLAAQLIADDPAAPRDMLRWMRARARAKPNGYYISEVCAELGVPRSTFYPRTTAVARRLVALLNAGADL